MNNLHSYLAKNEERLISRWKDFLRIPSISTDSTYQGECVRAAEWLKEHLTTLGFSAELIPTSGHPLVYGERITDPQAKTVLMYGHYDVQPVDPVEEWVTPPFEPTIRDEKMFCRGAVDNKGQLFAVLSGLEWALSQNQVKCNIKILVEGEEEHGSHGLANALPSITHRLGADIFVVSDTGTMRASAPALTLGLRGLADLEFVLHGSSQDLHSGIHGGVVRNPAIELAKIIASLHDDTGKVAVPGFYDGIPELTDNEKKLLGAGTITENIYQTVTGLQPVGGEKGFSLAARRGLRPTIEVNGLFSGYTGEGGKTIIPAKATVKISARLVRRQSPERCAALIKEFLEKRVPTGLRGEFISCQGRGECLFISPDLHAIQVVRNVIADEFGEEPECLWEGGSIPILVALSKASGATPVLCGFEMLGDNSHSPNECFALDRFRMGMRYFRALISTVVK